MGGEFFPEEVVVLDGDAPDALGYPRRRANEADARVSVQHRTRAHLHEEKIALVAQLDYSRPGQPVQQNS